MRRPSLYLMAILLALPSLAWAADLRIQLNPALAELHEENPTAAEARLEALLAIIERGPPADTEAPTKTRSIVNPGERSLVEGNPLIEEAYRIDPKAALEQLRLIVAAGGES